MILVDTSIWVSYIDHGDLRLSAYLEEEQVAMHPFVIGELALGNLHDRRSIMAMLGRLPQAVTAFPSEVLDFVERRQLFGTGIGYVDAHLLASTVFGDGMTLWSRDRLLHTQAERLGIAHDPATA